VDGVPTLDAVIDWGVCLMEERPLPLRAVFRRWASTKGIHWRYECEWRCWTENGADGRPTSQLFDDTPFSPNDMDAVYLGCRIEEETRQALLKLVSSQVPHAAVFQARQSSTRFALEFDRVT